MSTGNFSLGLPTDIPWNRICVSEDMLDENICDKRFPPKWHSSISMYKYVPDEAFQQYENFEISYLKVAVSITGYQPHDQEIEGNLAWDEMTVDTIEQVDDLLNEYHPCTGAIIQVSVESEDQSIKSIDGPYFLNFEPKKRELYEMATDTKEKMSRSLQSLVIGKSNTNTESLEVLDIDMGFSVSAQGSYAGTGGGGSYSEQGQWGTKSVSGRESGVLRTADNSNEKREAESFTTQISQLHHLLDSYHVGTNRALFFLEPRPHVIEGSSGFVSGPRPMDGIQEFFLVVLKPKDQKDYCVSVRMDTAHLAEIDVLDYDRQRVLSEVASVAANFPNKNDRRVGRVYREACAPPFSWPCWDVSYDCYEKTEVNDVTYTAPDGYIIESYDITINESTNGITSVNLAPGDKSLTLHAEAKSHRCFEGPEVCTNCPDTINDRTGSAKIQVQVNLKSETRTNVIGTEKVLLITTRGLCCCDYKSPPSTGIIAAIPVEPLVTAKGAYLGLKPNMFSVYHTKGTNQKSNDTSCDDGPRQNSGMITVQEANALGKLIRNELQNKAASRKSVNATPLIKSDYFIDMFEKRMLSQPNMRGTLLESLEKTKLTGRQKAAVEKYFCRPLNEIAKRHLIRLPNDEFQKATGLNSDDASELRLGLLNIRFAKQEEKPSNVKK